MADRLTNFYVDYNIEDTTAKADATFSTTNTQQDFTNIDRLKESNKNLTFDKFTFEHNFNILDGSRTEMENDAHNQLSFQKNSTVMETIIFEEDTDGTIIATSSSETTHELAYYEKEVEPWLWYGNTYYISACPKGGSLNTYYATITVGNTVYTDTGDGIYLPSVPYSTGCTIACCIAKDYIANGIVFHPVVSAFAPPYINTVVPYFNAIKSDINGEYPRGNPKVTITFSREHASFAFQMKFLDDHPLEAQLTFYSLDDSVITTFTQPILSNDVVITRDIYGYAKIEIEFTKTLPYRYIKFASFVFGIVVTWDETNVKDATMVQSVDRISKNIAIDTLTFTVIDVTNDMNLGNVEGMHRYFQRNQYMMPYETINGRKIPLGKFYLKTFSDTSNLGKMSAQTYIGMMDEIKFYDGAVYNGTPAGEVLEDIFSTMHCTNYIIDTETYNTPLYGTITPKSCRKALNDVLFVTNSVIDSHNMDNIIITKTSAIRRPDIPRNRKFTTSVTKIDYTYGVEIKYNQYVKDEDVKELAKGTYEAGTHTIYFSSPCEVTEINEGTIEKASTYYVTFTLAAETEVVVRGYGYTSSQSSVQYVRSKLDAGEGETIKSYSTSLCNSTTAKQLARKILEYLGYDLTIKIKWIADNNDMADYHIVENPEDIFNDYYGVFVKRSFNLTGGFIDTAEMVGTSIKEHYYKYLRESNYELLAGEEGLI